MKTFLVVVLMVVAAPLTLLVIFLVWVAGACCVDAHLEWKLRRAEREKRGRIRTVAESLATDSITAEEIEARIERVRKDRSR